MDDIKKEVGEIIDRLAIIYDEEDGEKGNIQNEIFELGKRLYELTGKTIEECEPFHAYWSYTDLDSIVERILMPKIEKKNLSERELAEIIEQICNEIEELDEAKLDYFLQVLEIETGIDNISDYFFYPERVGLDPDIMDGKHAQIYELTKKILADMKSGGL